MNAQTVYASTPDFEVCPAGTAKRLAALIIAADAVVDHWDSPQWKFQNPTSEVIGNLRRVIGESAP